MSLLENWSISVVVLHYSITVKQCTTNFNLTSVRINFNQLLTKTSRLRVLTKISNFSRPTLKES